MLEVSLGCKLYIRHSFNYILYQGLETIGLILLPPPLPYSLIALRNILMRPRLQ
jgi:hypothetical protein